MLEDPAFWALVGLVLFFAIVIYLKVPGMVAAGLDKRATTIRGELDQARKLREEAQALLAEYQRKARDAASEAEEIVVQAESARLKAKSRTNRGRAIRMKGFSFGFTSLRGRGLDTGE